MPIPALEKAIHVICEGKDCGGEKALEGMFDELYDAVDHDVVAEPCEVPGIGVPVAVAVSPHNRLGKLCPLADMGWSPGLRGRLDGHGKKFMDDVSSSASLLRRRYVFRGRDFGQPSELLAAEIADDVA